MPTTLFTSQSLLLDGRELVWGGGFCVEHGRVTSVCSSLAEVRAARGAAGTEVVDLGEQLVAPGLVNAHSHLELYALRGRVPADGGFGAWVGRVVALRAETSPLELAEGVRRGARRMLATGTTAVGDVDSTGLVREVLAREPLRAVLYHEALDAGDPGRTSEALARARVALAAGAGDTLRPGLSPHAPFSVSPALFEGLGVLAGEHGVPVTVHWSETEAELEYLLEGRGPLAGMLGPSPRASGLELVAAAGLLGPRTSLIHGNHPRAGEPQRIAAAGSVLVHCPGSHAFFDRAPFPLQAYRSAGVTLALGTDSAASNDDVDLLRETALARRTLPALSALDAWNAATTGAARALGWNTLGHLRPGARADFACHAISPSALGACLEELTAGRPSVTGVWVGGTRAV